MSTDSFRRRQKEKQLLEVARRVGDLVGSTANLLSFQESAELKAVLLAAYKESNVLRTWPLTDEEDLVKYLSRLPRLFGDRDAVLFIDIELQFALRVSATALLGDVSVLADVLDGDLVISDDSGEDFFWIELNFYRPDGTYHGSAPALRRFAGVRSEDHLRGTYEMRAAGSFAESV
ncbi:MAG: hypothetical protein ABI559_00775 [Chloroflexota bacterium]